MSGRMSDTILVAQDSSPAAHVATHTAIQIALSQGLSIHGLYVVDVNLAMDPYADQRAELGRSAELGSDGTMIDRFEEQGNAALTWLEELCRAAGVPVSVELEAGGVSQLVLKEAKQARLLALGRRGHGHPDDPHHLGSNFRAIAHRAPCPLLAGGDIQADVKHVLLAYHDSEHAGDALVWASILHRTLPATVDVVAVYEGHNGHQTDRWFEHIRGRLEQSNLPEYQFVRRNGEPASEISAAAEERGADLIVMGGHRHKGLAEWVVGSTMDRLLRSSPLPVLVA
jgi:nucleotide-binding universal stress UspA family protein